VSRSSEQAERQRQEERDGGREPFLRITGNPRRLSMACWTPGISTVMVRKKAN
jgi:hypothetical protein